MNIIIKHVSILPYFESSLYLQCARVHEKPRSDSRQIIDQRVQSEFQATRMSKRYIDANVIT